MKRKTLKILFPRKENYCKLFKLLKKIVKNISRRNKIKYTMENKSILSCLSNSDKELASVLYVTIDQDKKGKLLASLYGTKGKTNKIITNCKHFMDSKLKEKAVLKVTGITLTEKYTSLKIKLVEGLFRAYNSQSEATSILEQEILSDSEDSAENENKEDVESLN